MINVIRSLIGPYLLLNCLFLHSTHGITACEAGWFGRDCQYKCLCTGSRCDLNGQCMAGSKCQPGYFGPACQYGDIVQLTSLTSDAPLWLRDGDDATCSSDPSLQKITLRFRQGLSFSWFRISVSRPDAMNRFDVKLNNEVSCLNMKNTTVDNTSIDVYCSADTTVTSLTLSGPGVPFLCSVYISLGRNVADRESTRLSSINLHGELGNTLMTTGIHRDTTARGSSQLCSQTVMPGSSWNHTFATPQSVTALLWTTRHDDSSSGFIFKMFGTGGQLVNYGVTDKGDYYVPIERPEPVSLLSISVYPDKLLNLCQLFIFGESLCPEGTFGLGCESLCNCTDWSDICFISTGKCAAACTAGFYGWNCSAPCPTACKSGPCTSRHGDCIDESRQADVMKRKIEKRRGGVTIHIGCPLGFFGKECTTPCSDICEKSCDPVSGKCLKCDPGFYGVNCTGRCDALCFNSLCDEKDGFCLECPIDRWGNFCANLCGEHCYLQECNTTDGTCIVCAPGYKGADCVKVPWNVTLFIVLLFLIPSVIACFFCCEVLSDEDAEDPDRDLMSTDMSQQPSTSAM